MGNYRFCEINMERDLIVLINLFNSSEKNNLFLNPLAKKGVIWPPAASEEHLVQELLISLAIRMRMIDDMFIGSGKKANKVFAHVGEIKVGDLSKKLYFREACNKIVHAVRHEIERDEQGCFNCKVNFFGEKNGKAWMAVLDIRSFISEGLSLTSQYDEDWDISSRKD